MTARQSVIYYFYIHGALRDSWLVLETLNQLTKGVLSDRRIVTAWWYPPFSLAAFETRVTM